MKPLSIRRLAAPPPRGSSLPPGPPNCSRSFHTCVRSNHGQALQDRAGEAPRPQAEVQGTRLQPLRAVRAVARVPQQVPDVPHLLSQSRPEGRDHRSDQVELVNQASGLPAPGLELARPRERPAEVVEMSMTDPVADLLTRIRNAQRAGLEELELPASKIKQRICEVLRDEGFVRAITAKEGGIQGSLHVVLKYDEDKRPAISEIKRQSKPG